MNTGSMPISRINGTALAVSRILSSAAIIAGGLAFAPAAQAQVAPVGQGFTLNASDLRFILAQIKIAEAHAATPGYPCGAILSRIGSPVLPFGLRTVDGTCNNLVRGQEKFGAADLVFPRLTEPSFRPAEDLTFDPDGPGPLGIGNPTTYLQKSGIVNDSQPRTASNLIVDQTVTNPAAVVAAGPAALPDFSGTLFIPNLAPDVGLSAPYNSMFTLFGQFFDHGLDLVTKGGGTVFVPLQSDDPLFIPGSPTNFMVLTRATNQPGPDGLLGTADDIQEATNTTTPFVDQNQTYTSHPSHQVFLRAYVAGALGPVATGNLIDGAIPGNIGNWGEVKAQAAGLLGIQLSDQDVLNVPLVATDPYGRFIPGPNGHPQIVLPGNVLVEGDPLADIGLGLPVPANAIRTGHAFLDDIAHHAVPFGDHDNNPATPRQALLPDADLVTIDDSNPATYDDELLAAHFITGDGRGNENIGLTTVHTVFHSEHNRLADDIDVLLDEFALSGELTPAEIADWTSENPASGWNYGERLFQAARFVTEMEYQHLVFEEFARKVQPQVNVFSGYHTEINPAISAEFAHTVYRFGHSMLTEVVARTDSNGLVADIPLLDAFLNPLAFNEVGVNASEAAGSIVRGMTDQVGNELDEFVTEALRNGLLGLPLDLAAINMARGRSEGVPTLNSARRQFFNATGNPALAPYESWVDFELGARHPESLVNFIAAYGTHPSITGDMASRRAAAEFLVTDTSLDSLDFMFGTGSWSNLFPSGETTTGLDNVDFWVGGLAEKQAPFGGLLGSTFNHVFETQLEDLQDGDRFYYLSRTAGLNLLVQLEGNSFAELIMRNTDAVGLPADVFSRADFTFNLAFLGTSGPILNDPATPYDESAMLDLRRMPNGAIRYSGPAHVIWNGRNTLDVDRIVSSEGDDTLRGNGGRDIMEGGAGNDQFIGGDGDDILTDSFGDDVLKGGNGHDAMSSGQGFDLNQGGLGNDFVVGGSDPTETFGGPGNDIIFAGDSFDTVFGDDGDDWIEGGGQADLLQGDNGAPFQNDPNQPGHDVIIGDGGNDDYDSEGGDDIMVVGPGIERNEGILGFDWVTHRGDPQPADADMNFTGLLPPDLENIRDRFDLVEGLSGWQFSDTLRGDSGDATTMVGHELNAAGIARIAGLSTLLPAGATSFTGGNIIIGGAGSDVIEGRGGDDIIDGDAWLNVQLEAPVIGLVDSMTQLRTAVFAGTLNPGSISIRRSIVTTGALPADVDTAVYSDVRANYSVARNADGSVTVAHTGGTLADGTDTLRNMERLAFLDQNIPVPSNVPATGTVTIDDTTPAENQLLTVTSVLADLNGVGTITNTWQAETALNVWAAVVTGDTFTPGDPVVGQRLRVVASFTDGAGNPESVTSAPTAAVTAVNDPATGAPILNPTAPVVGTQVSALPGTIGDLDGLGTFSYQWLANNAAIAGATSSIFTPTVVQLGQTLAVVVSFTDGQGFPESRTSAASTAVAAAGGTGAVASLPASLDFGNRRINTNRTQNVRVTNTGTAPLIITSATTSGAPFTTAGLGTCAAPVAVGRSCRLSVTFRPTAVGAYSGTLRVVSNATNNPVLILSGTGR